jgi:hypothetical protein
MAATALVVLGPEEPATVRLDAQQREVVAGHDVAVDQLGVAALAHADVDLVVGRHAREGAGMIANVEVVGIGEADRELGVALPGVQAHELARPVDLR